MKFSVIVPVYNAENYLHKLVESVLQQTYKDYELILVDDGSTDGSYALMKQYAKRYDQIKAYTKENTGPGMTRKFGFEKATGDLLFFVDEFIKKALSKNPAGNEERVLAMAIRAAKRDCDISAVSEFLGSRDQLLIKPKDEREEEFLYQTLGFVLSNYFKETTRALRCLNRAWRISEDEGTIR